MDKNYVLEGALVSCEFGCRPCELKTLSHRHITEGGSNVANETDYTAECIKGFGQCRSGFGITSPAPPPEGVNNIQQMGGDNGGGKACIPQIAIPWQNTKPDVKIGLYRALLEEGWTICSKGFGIITLMDSGQAGQSTIAQILENLQILQKIVAQYVRENQISDKHKEALLESVLLWSGYSNESIVWEYKSNDIKNEFCEYLAIENPGLYGFFERKLEITAADGEKVDVSYMMGLYKALQERPPELSLLNNPIHFMLTEETVSDDGMFNAFLEAGLQKPAQPLSGMLETYLKEEQTPAGNHNRYDDYISKYRGKEDLLEWSLNQAMNSHPKEPPKFSGFLDPEESQTEETDDTVKKFMEKFQEKREGRENERD